MTARVLTQRDQWPSRIAAPRWDELAQQQAEARAERRRKALERYSDDDIIKWFDSIDDDDDAFPHLADELAERSATSPRAAEYWKNATGG